MAYGWGTSSGLDTFCQGNEVMLCGPSCAVMAIRWVSDVKLDARSVAHTKRQKATKGKYVSANVNNPTMVLAMPGLADPVGSNSGVGKDSIEDILKEQSLTFDAMQTDASGFTKDQLKTSLKRATFVTPVIVGLDVPPHYVICIAWKKKVIGGNKFSFVDPADGHIHEGGQVSGNKLILGTYNTVVDHLINITGVVTHQQIKVMM